VGVEFEDYYSVLGVDRDASQDEIQRAYKKKARKYHPDVSDESDAEEQFKKVNEAYQVLKDPDKRKKYDRMGKNWKAGQNVDPPPGWENVRVNMGGGGGGAGFEDIFGQGGGGGGAGAGGFSDFFNAFFSQAAGPQAGGARGRGRSSGGGQRQRRGRSRQKGRSQTAKITVTLEDVYHGRERSVAIPLRQRQPDGRVVQQRKTYTVTIPPGTTEGSKIRLAGQGEQGAGGAGDVLLEVHIADHPDFEVDDYDLRTEVAITPWEAALGAKVTVPTVDGEVTVSVPAGSQSGRKLRLRDKGLPDDEGGRGNLYAELSIAVPDELTERERELFEELAEESAFDPRG
jgi:curved DNA-binding protein